MARQYAMYLASLALFGSNGIIAAMVSLPSLDIVVARTFLGAALLCALLAAAALAARLKRRTRKGAAAAPAPVRSDSGSMPADRRGRARALACYAVSGAALGASWITLFEAYRLIGVGTASLAYYCGPVIVMALSPLVFRERLSARKLLGFAAVAVGAVCVSAQALEGGQNVAGLALGGASAVLYAVMIVFSKLAARACPREADRGLRNAAIQLCAGFAVAAAYSVAMRGLASLAVPAAPSDVTPLLVLGLVNTGVGCFLYFSSLGKLPVQTVAVCGYLEPLSAVVLSVVVLGEPMGAIQLAGAVLIVGGAAFCELSDRVGSYSKERCWYSPLLRNPRLR